MERQSEDTTRRSARERVLELTEESLAMENLLLRERVASLEADNHTLRELTEKLILAAKAAA